MVPPPTSQDGSAGDATQEATDGADALLKQEVQPHDVGIGVFGLGGSNSLDQAAYVAQAATESFAAAAVSAAAGGSSPGGGRGSKSSKAAEHKARPKPPRPENSAPCPRCGSSDTKFCYYNNYNVKQPRYFCKSCQRYWTAGGTLRNVPPGSGRRKSKSAAAKEQEKMADTIARTTAVTALMNPSLAAVSGLPFVNPSTLLADHSHMLYNAAAQQQLLASSTTAAALNALSKIPQWANGLTNPMGANILNGTGSVLDNSMAGATTNGNNPAASSGTASGGGASGAALGFGNGHDSGDLTEGLDGDSNAAPSAKRARLDTSASASKLVDDTDNNGQHLIGNNGETTGLGIKTSGGDASRDDLLGNGNSSGNNLLLPSSANASSAAGMLGISSPAALVPNWNGLTSDSLLGMNTQSTTDPMMLNGGMKSPVAAAAAAHTAMQQQLVAQQYYALLVQQQAAAAAAAQNPYLAAASLPHLAAYNAAFNYGALAGAFNPAAGSLQQWNALAAANQAYSPPGRASSYGGANGFSGVEHLHGLIPSTQLYHHNGTTSSAGGVQGPADT